MDQRAIVFNFEHVDLLACSILNSARPLTWINASSIAPRTKALALRTRERRRTYRSFRNETHSTVSFRLLNTARTHYLLAFRAFGVQKLSLIAPCLHLGGQAGVPNSQAVSAQDQQHSQSDSA